MVMRHDSFRLPSIWLIMPHRSLKFRGNLKNRLPAENRQLEASPEGLKCAVEEQKVA